MSYVSAGTNITIRGKNLGNDKSDIVKVTVGTHECDLNTMKHSSNQKIKVIYTYGGVMIVNPKANFLTLRFPNTWMDWSSTLDCYAYTNCGHGATRWAGD